jgi:hypothetical protein
MDSPRTIDGSFQGFLPGVLEVSGSIQPAQPAVVTTNVVLKSVETVEDLEKFVAVVKQLGIPGTTPISISNRYEDERRIYLTHRAEQ